jgi:hypothetical protein
VAFDLQLEQAKYLQGIHDVKALPSVAQNALEAGYDSHSLRMLAGLEKPTVWDAEPMWFQALEELQVVRLDKSEALLQVADWIIDEWEAGRLQLVDASATLERMCWQNGYDQRLYPIYEVASYVGSGLATDANLIEAFGRFKLRDFSRRRFPMPEFESDPEEPVTPPKCFWSRFRRFFAS